MKQITVVIAAIVGATLLPAIAAAQDRVDPMAGTVAQWLSMIEKSFVGLADAMPEDEYGFKPTNGAFKEGQLVVYLRMNGIVPPASAQ